MSAATPLDGEYEVDVAVMGSGAAGLVAALTASVLGLRVLLCEKDAQVGGTTATSGGSCWVPGNHLARQRGLPEDDSAATYLDREVGAPDDDGRRRAFLEAAPRAFEFIERHSALKFSLPAVYPDYHPAQEGAATGGRTLQPVPFDGRRLGDGFALVRSPNRGQMILGGMMVNRPEAKLLVRPFASHRAFAFAARAALRYARDRFRYRRGTRLLLGNALVGSLLLTLRERGVEIWTLTPLVELDVADGGVRGAIVLRDGRRVRIHARRAVVLATGGFTSSPALRSELAPAFRTDWALSVPGATGDGLAAARAAGADVDTGHAAPMFFMPASILHGSNGSAFAFPHIIADRARPGLIAVDPTGRRFVNEADSYHDFVMAMYRKRLPRAYLICDRRSLRDYGIGLVRPIWQWVRWYVDAGYLISAKSVAELADRIGAHRGELAHSIAEHNTAARTGVDAAFGKGGNALNRFNGDAAVAPNPCLRSIEVAPFFAVAVYPAAIGASVGLRTDGDARVLDRNGRPIPGLYACGNDQASVMRGSYPGPGITLGPAMAFAFRAMEDAARAPAEATISPTHPRPD